MPKLEEYEDPLNLDQATISKYGDYVDSINKLFEKYEEQAACICISETINFVERIFPYVHPNLKTHEGTINSLKEVCTEDNQYSALALKRLLEKFGEQFITLNNGRTTIIKALIVEKYSDFYELARDAKEIC